MRSISARLAALAVLAAATSVLAEPAAVPPKASNPIDNPGRTEAPGHATIPQIRKLNKVSTDTEPQGTGAASAASGASAPAPSAAAEPKAAASKDAPAAAATPAKEAAAPANEKAAEKAVAKTVAPPPKPQPTVVISVNLTKQSMSVSENGRQLYTWPVSSGRSGYDTPTGTFRPQWMAKMWHSRKYDDAPMPNSIFFTGGFAIHATAAYSQLGRPASHGCIRLSPTNAATLFKMVQKHGMDATKIAVHGRPHYDSPIARSEPRGAAPRQMPVRYVVARAPSSPLEAIFGGEPRRIVYGTPSAPRAVRAPSRPQYVVLQNGAVVRLR
jgi:lipoprotein-anchoring transpeptidase ErfK/SrfK